MHADLHNHTLLSDGLDAVADLRGAHTRMGGVIGSVRGEVRFTLDLARDDWVVLRVSDPDQPHATPGPAGHPCNDLAVAYSSPWWFQPA